MPTNLYGPNDNFDLENSHVLPALIRKFHEARISQVRSEKLDERSNVSHPRLTSHEATMSSFGEPALRNVNFSKWTIWPMLRCSFMNLPDDVYSALLTANFSPALLNIGTGEEIVSGNWRCSSRRSLVSREN